MVFLAGLSSAWSAICGHATKQDASKRLREKYSRLAARPIEEMQHEFGGAFLHARRNRSNVSMWKVCGNRSKKSTEATSYLCTGTGSSTGLRGV